MKVKKASLFSQLCIILIIFSTISKIKGEESALASSDPNPNPVSHPDPVWRIPRINIPMRPPIMFRPPMRPPVRAPSRPPVLRPPVKPPVPQPRPAGPPALTPVAKPSPKPSTSSGTKSQPSTRTGLDVPELPPSSQPGNTKISKRRTRIRATRRPRNKESRNRRKKKRKERRKSLGKELLENTVNVAKELGMEIIKNAGEEIAVALIQSLIQNNCEEAESFVSMSPDSEDTCQEENCE